MWVGVAGGQVQSKVFQLTGCWLLEGGYYVYGQFFCILGFQLLALGVFQGEMGQICMELQGGLRDFQYLLGAGYVERLFLLLCLFDEYDLYEQEGKYYMGYHFYFCFFYCCLILIIIILEFIIQVFYLFIIIFLTFNTELLLISLLKYILIL